MRLPRWVACSSGIELLLLISCSHGKLSPPSSVPPLLHVPEGSALLWRAPARGVQIYTCKMQLDGGKLGWELKAPEAELLEDGAPVGRHYAGPTWETQDGSKVRAALDKRVPAPDKNAIPWLLLKANGAEGPGVLGKVTFIQRLETSGGKAPDDACGSSGEGGELRVPYTATYYFYGSPSTPATP